MLVTLCYVYLWVRFQKCYSAVILTTLRRLYAKDSSLSFTFCALDQSSPEGRPAGQSSDSVQQPSLLLPERNVFLRLGDKAIFITEPQACDDLSKWTVLLGSSLVYGPGVENILFIIEGASGHSVDNSSHSSNKDVLKWSDYCVPLACSPKQPYRAVAQASVYNFSCLGVAFMEDRLQLDDGLVPSKIVSVLRESALKQLEEKQHLASQKNLNLLSPNTRTESVLSDLSQGFPCDWLAEPQKGSLLLAPESNGRIQEQQDSQPPHNSQVLGTVCKEEVQSLGSLHRDGNCHPLHLSSCHECLELENSTIDSVRYASVENIPELPDDASGYKALDDGKGFLDRCSSIGSRVKPPNVLVYTGGCQERYQTIHELLTECISTDKYVIYHLQPQRALTDPWPESTTLLLLAEEEPLRPELQTCFLTYMSQGGKVLGLSSTLCPAGLSLEARHAQHRQVSRLSFTREDSTEVELNVLASGHVFTRDQQGGGELELWGELKQPHAHGKRDMVIVRMTHGDNGGEAVLCQVHLELSPSAQHVALEDFNDLKVSNAHRYEVLAEILTSLGLSCEQNLDTRPSAIYILSTSQKHRATFLMWLRTHADKDGLIKLPKASLKLVADTELQHGSMLPHGSLALETNLPESQGWENFNLETYTKHLQTRLLGRVVLYTDVTPSTMDILEGLTLNLSTDIGLIAVAGRQTQGRGRRGNVWLSPRGGAMFTVSVQVALNSRLGQRIPFLQHLAALAVVEAVRTLPGYQNIDLRVKWPNDIYYSNQVKLGGVLVTSTVMGPTFHLLIGCGVNVSNSNPTICINDLVSQHNREHASSLEALDASQLIGRTVTCLEGLIAVFQQEGPDAILPTYYKRWIHSGTSVHLWSKDGPEVEVVGLDNNGFLQVHCKEKGVVSVEPDGNSFDMLRNLVVIKQH